MRKTFRNITGWFLAMVALCVMDAGTARSQHESTGDEAFAARFVRLLIDGSDSLSYLLDPSESGLSSRLGIQYDGIPNKFLIGFDFDDETSRELRHGTLKCRYTVEELPEGFMRVKLNVPDHGEGKSFYFTQKKQLISPVYYFTRLWVRKESPHFSFWIGDTSLFHPEAIVQLESFLHKMAGFLRFSEDEMRQLEKEKIIYVLCRDEGEIEQLTGFKSRGMCLLAYDYVTTTYSCHFHELMHLLVNFKLHRLPLYTHPLLQEGLAVACGGRGGIAPPSLQQTGVFLCQTGGLGYGELLSTLSFKAVDPSMSYPVSGLYVRFLIDRLGIDRFLGLYRKFSGDGEHIGTMVMDTSDLPREAEWRAFLGRVGKENPIQVRDDVNDGKCLVADSALTMWESGRYYHVRMKQLVALKPQVVETGYTSKRFAEICPGRTYHGERYLFEGDTSEVTIYDLYTNNSIAGYSSAFSEGQVKVKQINGRLAFRVLKEVFAGRINTMQVVGYER